MERADLYDMIAVERIDGSADGAETFRGTPVSGPYGRVFGGQLIGQAVAAATTAVEQTRPGRAAHSLHAYFLSVGDPRNPIDYEVAAIRDGRSFSVRSVRARQDGRLLLTAELSFQDPAKGPTHEEPRTTAYPEPESLPTCERGPAGAVHRTAVEIRRVPPELDPKSELGPRPGQAVWLRAAAPRSGVSDRDGRAVLAMATDFTVLESVVKGHGLTFATEGLTVASLDHSMWWHAPGALDEWVLYLQESPWSGGQRGLVTGRLYTRDGRLLASVVQEGLLRIAPSAPVEGAS
ncbi:acyl-CoA thioesterase [Glycomyces tenuis]|uniref:acyl-CoA thioesterase n=1 Tax=Glycomyces tenuis TaxID=58116 RepID=UPI00041A6E64|nr:acyl-CoA thioesterase domain-containing protein [Glycomyces tenuis]